MDGESGETGERAGGMDGGAEMAFSMGGQAMIMLQLDHDASAARTARRAVRDVLTRHAAETRDQAVLLADELVTNALVHGQGRIGLRVEDSAGWIRVQVSDLGPARPIVQLPGADDEHGRGLVIVDALATAWGVEETPTGKSVWFRLDLED